MDGKIGDITLGVWFRGLSTLENFIIIGGPPHMQQEFSSMILACIVPYSVQH
jgi:hypothetical protein